jgi:hypothetical protein
MVAWEECKFLTKDNKKFPLLFNILKTVRIAKKNIEIQIIIDKTQIMCVILANIVNAKVQR